MALDRDVNYYKAETRKNEDNRTERKEIMNIREKKVRKPEKVVNKELTIKKNSKRGR